MVRIGLALSMIAVSLPSGAAAQEADAEAAAQEADAEAAAQDLDAQATEAAAKLQRIEELMAVRESARFVSPLPGSRSVVIAADVSTPLFFFLERGSIRGTAINDFYEAYESGNGDEAYASFLRNSIMTMRVTDYGWNGLGVPMVTEAGSEIHDIVFRDVEGVFARVVDVTADDRAAYQELLDAILTVLEESS